MDTLLERGANIAVQKEVGPTTLHIAAGSTRADEVRKLLDAGADVNAQDKYGATPLMYALMKNAMHVCQVLLRHQAINVNACTHDGVTTLMVAMKCMDKVIVEDLITAGADVNATEKSYQYTTLHLAVSSTNIAAVLVLIKLGANAAAQNDNGETPLRHATHTRPDVVRALLDAGADVNAQDKLGRTALHFAATENEMDVLETLLHHHATNVDTRTQMGSTPLMSAAGAVSENTASVIKALIVAGADVNAADNAGSAALHWAATVNTTDVVAALLHYGANVNAQDYEGETPLHRASRRRDEDGINTVAALLLRAGADVNAQDVAGRSPLHWTVLTNSVTVFHGLIAERAINLNVRMHNGQTPLMLAAASTVAPSMAVILVNVGADVNVADDTGTTALHFAAAADNVARASALLRYGANVDAQDNMGQTPLFIAAREGFFWMCRLLLRKFANRDITDHAGRSPRYIAAEALHLNIVRLLDNECVLAG